jgi:hypothetical protein
MKAAALVAQCRPVLPPLTWSVYLGFLPPYTSYSVIHIRPSGTPTPAEHHSHPGA